MPGAECDACEGGAAGAEVSSGATGGQTGGTESGGKGGSGARGGSAGASAGGSGGSGESGSGGSGEGPGGTAGAGGSSGGASGMSAGGSAGVAAAGGTGGSSGSSGMETGGSGGDDPAGFPLTDLLDDFEQPDAFDDNWIGSLDDFTVADGVLTCNNCPHAALHEDRLDADQEAFVTLASFEGNSDEINLILLAQNEICELIEVLFSPLDQVLQVHTCYLGMWVEHGSTSAMLAAGDRFGARLHSDGTVQVFVNGVERLKVALGALPNDAGRIGVSGNTTAPIVFDDFGGGVWR